MAITFDKALGVHQHTVGVRARRSEVIASNIANADTPNYKARDLDFNKAFAAAKSKQSGGMQLTNERHIGGGNSQFSELGFQIPDQPDTGDGNTVDVQKEKAAFMQNGLEYQAGIGFLSSKFSGLRNAIKGGQ
ncbi:MULTISPECIES: flagellar basal body rod protein FlgB [unclassified Agarivorans]|uniref:flagellar basal body rod protein FlgB n=1 Tax=unclassified Agarivorans TaxID=2636026 RepID=UPI0010F243A6|nr:MULTISPECIES: flagellar basal body rod protein FlgB [unclassified Agarivorans]MDO6684687.1 flagellar basal body rod protein FlgB [Agarivorans sp. 3_MG-2023]MDO6715152.1 flagellar basal body rod protein FlgB [Agarivorans sp. 2_MG-2023]MDO6763928.1 flagellar basal body rod protein FlgB [Agarivorans sp. 1_MG-2023]GDY27948.1 flagellar basal body rod protein FlgB [Agarivorans sp. Toyoura001]